MDQKNFEVASEPNKQEINATYLSCEVGRSMPGAPYGFGQVEM